MQDEMKVTLKYVFSKIRAYAKKVQNPYLVNSFASKICYKYFPNCSHYFIARIRQYASCFSVIYQCKFAINRELDFYKGDFLRVDKNDI